MIFAIVIAVHVIVYGIYQRMASDNTKRLNGMINKVNQLQQTHRQYEQALVDAEQEDGGMYVAIEQVLVEHYQGKQRELYATEEVIHYLQCKSTNI